VIDRSLVKFGFYNLRFFLNIRWALLFSSLVPYLFSIFNIPQIYWV
jgi:hypothetical protein